MSDPVRERWAAGEVALNAWSTFGGASAATVLAATGFDAVTVDLQHGEHTLERLGEVVARSSAPAPSRSSAWAGATQRA
jgi:2-keto-3-deoxy-L-rhamnonate aldolase RhmA